MKKLSQLKDDPDPRLQHNVALVEYQLAGAKAPKSLLDRLVKVKDSVDAREKPEVVVDDDDETYEEERSSVLQYNQAVLLFRLGHFSSTAVLLEELYVNVEALDDLLAYRVCFLLIDLYMKRRDAGKADLVLSYLRAPKSFPSLWSESQDGAHEEEKASADTKTLPTKHDMLRLAPRMTETQFRFAVRLSSARVRLLQRAFPLANLEIRAALQIYQREQDRVKKEDIGQTPDLLWRHVASALFLKAQLAFLKHHYHKATQLLHACQEATNADTGKARSACLYLNNLACVYYRTGKYTTAGFLLHKAMACKTWPSTGRPRLWPASRERQEFAINTPPCGSEWQSVVCLRATNGIEKRGEDSSESGLALQICIVLPCPLHLRGGSLQIPLPIHTFRLPRKNPSNNPTFPPPNTSLWNLLSNASEIPSICWINNSRNTLPAKAAKAKRERCHAGTANGSISVP